MWISAKSAVVVAALAAAAIAAPLASAQEASKASTRRHVVEIQKFKFVPAELEASPGDTIVWINRDIVPHTVTAKDKSWDSRTIKKDGEWQTIVGADLAGAYFCRFHPAMKGAVRAVQ